MMDDKIVLIIIILIQSCICEEEKYDSKRILVTDTDFLLHELNSLKSRIGSLESTVGRMQNGGSGALYTRWGRTSCEGNGTQLVYTGFGGGSWYDHQGTATNYLCMPTDPIWDHYSDDHGAYRGRVYGMEYEHIEFDSNLHNENVPCAVCRVESGSTVLMIPGRNQCYSGWKREYYGYLMSGSYNEKASTEYICLDAAPETLYAGHGNENGALLHSVESICGSLPCGPYVDGRELTCVVCSK